MSAVQTHPSRGTRADTSHALETRRKPKLAPLEREALLLRHQRAIDLLNYPDVNELEHELPLAQRESLLAAVVWPNDELLAWSLERARAKLAARL